MLDALRFVQGAVAKKDFVVALTHFHIRDGVIRGFNGSLGLSCPIDLNLDVCPKAVPFVKAIQTCKETIKLHMTENGRLSIKSGNFKALVECVEPESFPEATPEGTVVPLNGDLLGVLKKLAPFIADDASRSWARGILLRGQSAFATNNISLVEYWLGYTFPVEINIPKTAVTELLRIGEEPESLQMTENSVTFHFSNGRWLRSQTYTTVWPDLAPILDRPSTLAPIPEGLWEAVESLIPFVDDIGRIFMTTEGVSTGHGDAAGATVELAGLPEAGCFHFQQLLLLKGVITKIDLSTYPKPCAFVGDRLRGAIVGIRIV